MIVTPSMSLYSWNSVSDPYSSGQLSDNFNTIDMHTHAPGQGVQIPTAGIRNYAITSIKIAPGAVGSAQLGVNVSVPTGTVVMYASATAPTGFLRADGTLYEIAAYPTLFAVITNTFGGDGISTFAVPNYTNNFPVGAGSTYTLGETGGSTTGQLTSASQLPPHSHSITDPGHTHTVIDPTHAHVDQAFNTNEGSSIGAQWTQGALSYTNVQVGFNTGYTTNVATGVTNADAETGITGTNNTGASTTFPTTPPFVACYFIVKT